MSSSYQTKEAADTISKRAVKSDELDMIVDRLYRSETMSGKICRQSPTTAVDKIARKLESNEEIMAVYKRLNSTHTKSSSPQNCKGFDTPNPPGYGQKMFPIIDGLDTRFGGKNVPAEKVNDVISRLHTSQTKSSKSRMDNPRILLYPERTLLCNDVERIKAYQDTGETVKQPYLDRREKWYV